MGIPASQRLRKQSEFHRVRRSELRVHRGPFIVQFRLAGDAKTDSPPKLGVIASRRVGNAVKRNRGKRLVREIFRLNAESLPSSGDCVIVLRAGFYRYDFAELEAHFKNACSQIFQTKDWEGFEK